MQEIEIKEFTNIVELKDSMNHFVSQLNQTLSQLATKKDLEAFATKKDLEAFATKKDLEKFASKEDLKAFVTKDDLKEELEIVKDSTKKGLDSLAKAINSIRDHLGIKVEAEI
ncbi:hypothetical protein HY224_00980 [Candidatus Uhrbacteria bacterium]|nr:hypothetical protein [Candidatus Uhrbacteria bacterium]